jgi:hypothetical protein
MKFQDKLKKITQEELWQEYCGFLDLTITEYMFIQRRLMQEQMQLWKNSGLGKLLLGNKNPETIDELREMMPLTTYEDYAETLLSKRVDMLPAEPVTWIQTTWEGGLRPIKIAPYTRAMLNTYRHNILSVMILCSCDEKGAVNVRKGDRILYGGAPLPYATGLMPSLLAEDIDLTWLPDTNEKSQLPFSQRIKKGFEMAFRGGVDYFFAIGSVANYITSNFSKSSGSGNKKFRISPLLALRYLKAKYIGIRDSKQVEPGNVFRLKGFVCTGTDAKCYRERLTKAWNKVPIELSAGTESTCIGVENWEHRGMIFFPDTCFYEFIPETEMRKSLNCPGYNPRTCLMDEVITGENYELVISVFHGGAFMRYRIGDMYRCLSAGKGDCLPRFTFLDRVPNVIDIAGFTRITQQSIEEVFRLSRIGIGQWLAKKEYDDNGNPYLHLYIEILPEAQELDVVNKTSLLELLSVYFKYYDSDYNDLKKLLEMEPLKITVLKYGSIDQYSKFCGHELSKMNPSNIDIAELLRYQSKIRSGIREEVVLK